MVMGANHPPYEEEDDRIFTKKPDPGLGDATARSNFIHGSGFVAVGVGQKIANYTLTSRKCRR